MLFMHDEGSTNALVRALFVRGLERGVRLDRCDRLVFRDCVFLFRG